MLTYTCISKGIFGLADKPNPTLKHERYAIVKVTLAALYGKEHTLFENKRGGVIKVAVEC